MSPRGNRRNQGIAGNPHPSQDRTSIPIPPVAGMVHLNMPLYSGGGAKFSAVWAPCWRVVTRSYGQWFLCGFNNAYSVIPFILIPSSQFSTWLACPEQPALDEALMPFAPASNDELDRLEAETEAGEDDDFDERGDGDEGEDDEPAARAAGRPSFSPQIVPVVLQARGAMKYGELLSAVMEGSGCSERTAQKLITKASESGLILKIGMVYMHAAQTKPAQS